jgi:hypothetical protein
MEYTEEEWRRKMLYARQRSELEKLYQAGAMTWQELQVDDQRLADTLEVCIVSGDPDPSAKLRKQQELEKRLSSYINLTNIARQTETDKSPSVIIQTWLRNHNTLEFLMYWEKNNNMNFDSIGYEQLAKKILSGDISLTPKLWIESTNAIGIISKQGNQGGTLAHPIIANDFKMWCLPEYRYLIQKTIPSKNMQFG